MTRRRFIILLSLASLPAGFRAGLAQDGSRPGSIHVLARKGDIAGVRQLLKDNPKLIEFAQQGQGTPIAVAARAGQVEMIRFLIEQRADVNGAEPQRGTTVLMTACGAGNLPAGTRLRIVRLLVEKGANVRARDDRKTTALHHAAAAGHVKVIEYLLERKAEVNARDALGATPLVAALRAHRSAAADLLRRYGGRS